MKKLKKVLLNIRVILLVVCLLLAVAAINPDLGAEGVTIRSVDKNSSAENGGISSPKASTPPRSREVLRSINNVPIKNVKEYYSYIDVLPVNQTVAVKTTKGSYLLLTKESSGQADLGLVVYEAPTSNIRKGLDLTGGTRVILKPEEKIDQEDLEILLENIKQRLNVFGLSDIIVRDAADLGGNTFIIVEIAGATEKEVADLVAKQGKFEASVANTTVFRGGNDVTYVCRSADCSGIDPRRACGKSDDGLWYCSFYFQISLSPEAAKRQADATMNLTLVTDQGGSYLSEPLLLYLDDEEVDSLNIASGLQGRPVTDISITGSGSGVSEEDALANTLEQMKRLQTILITGSLPVKLNIEKTDTISPVLGEQFLNNSIMIGLMSILAVVVTVFIRYRRFVVSIPMVVVMVSEAVIILGLAAAIGWNLDLAAIAGIIIAIGTGVDDQIVIADETLTRRAAASWKERLKSAFFIIFAAYFTLVVAMIPLWFAGAGLLRGFAITTILGVSVGVFITRPAFAAFIEIFSSEK